MSVYKRLSDQFLGFRVGPSLLVVVAAAAAVGVIAVGRPGMGCKRMGASAAPAS
jgi:hypothetical protein